MNERLFALLQPFDIFYRSRRRRYGHFISLGSNCEVAYQCVLRYDNVESSVFTWAGGRDARFLINALKRFDDICAGEIVYHPQYKMYECANTNIFFHSKLSHRELADATDALIARDREEVRSRIRHLKEKFRKSAADGQRNLYVYKYPETDETPDAIHAAILEMHSLLAKMVANDFDLLFVFAGTKVADKLRTMPLPDNLLIRSVNFFAPNSDVTGKVQDTKGWNKIFREFVSDSLRVKKTKRFKFERA